MHYRDKKLSIARTAAARLADDPQVDSIYLAGSLTAGLGSPTSDLDVFAVVNSDAESQVRQVTTEGERMDVETYPIEWFRGVLSKVEQWSTSRGDLRSTELNKDELDVLLRLRQMETIKDSPALSEIRSRLAANDDRLRQMTLSHWALEANGQLSDFKGSCADEDFTTAALIGQSLLVSVGKALAAATGDLYYGTKWVYIQLGRALGKEFPHNRYASLQSGAWVGDDPRGGMKDFLSFFQTLSVAGQVLGWGSADVNEWPFWETGPGALRRNPQYNVIHLTEGVLLNNELRRQFVVEPQVALVWGLCNGRELDEVVNAAVTLSEHLPDSSPVPPLLAEHAQEMVSVLISRGLVSQELFR